MTPENTFFDRRSEAGETLIEVLLSSALMAMVVVAILGGVATMVLGSSVHRDQTEANPSLISAMEELKSPGTPRRCPAGTQTLPAYPLPVDVEISEIWYQVVDGSGVGWDDDPGDCDDMVLDTSTPQPDDLVATVPAGTPDPDNPLTLQRIKLKYIHPDGNVVQEFEFVKGDH